MVLLVGVVLLLECDIAYGMLYFWLGLGLGVVLLVRFGIIDRVEVVVLQVKCSIVAEV